MEEKKGKQIVKSEEYDKALVKNGSVSGLVDMLVELDGMIPYLELSPKEDTIRYCEKKDIPVNNIQELKLFHNYVEDKLADFGDSDEKAKRYFELREYRTQLERLPQELSKLEQTATLAFDELKKPFKAVMYCLVEAVIKHGFKMEEDGNNAVEKYPGSVKISRVNGYRIGSRNDFAKLNVTLDNNHFNDQFSFIVYPFYKKEIEEITTNEIEKLKVNAYRCFEGLKINYNEGEAIIDYLKETVLMNSDRYMDSSKSLMKIIFNLPKIMENYTKKTHQNLECIFDKNINL